MKRNLILRTVISTLLCLMMVTPTLADVLTLPSGTKVIEEYAFYGDTSIDEVVLPEGIEEIGEYAFAESGLTKINLPSTLEEGSIADNAIDKDKDVEVTAIEGTDAYDWAVDNGFIKKTILPELPATDFKYTNNGDGTCTITGYKGGITENFVIPSKNPDGLIVTAIANSAFVNSSKANGQLVIPATVTSIGRQAFLYCSGLTGDLIIPDSVVDIGYMAFDGCDGFNGSIRLGSGLLSIGESAFSGCSNLTGNLIIPDSVTNIGASAFYDCSGLNGRLVISKNISSIADNTFTHCSGFIGGLVIPDKVVSIGDMAFFNGGFTGNLILGSHLTDIGDCAFESCGFTGDLLIPDNVERIGEYAFACCSGFSGSLTIGNGVTSINKDVFASCSGFSGTLRIGENVTTIGENAFSNCSGFTGDLIIPDSVISIGSNAFFGCKGFSGDLIIGDGLTSIGSDAFSYMNFTGQLSIGSHVSVIEDYAFRYSSGFTGDLIIPSNVTSIGKYAFEHCSGFDGNLVLSNGLISIGAYAFSECDGLTGNLNVPNSVTSIGEYAFNKCNGFDGDLIIGDGVTNIGSYAFWNCDGFTGNLRIGDGVKCINYSAFSGCSGFSGRLTLGNKLETINSYAFSGCSGLMGNLVIPDSVTLIERNAFSGCSGFDGVLVLSSNITDIADNTFSGCSKLSGSLRIPSGVTRIGNYAFQSCYSFTGDLSIPDSVTSIGNYSFYECRGFDGDLKIGNNVISIGERAFISCGFKGRLTIGNRVESIGNYAFAHNSGLTGDLLIPQSVSTIGSSAFSYCSNLFGTMTIGDQITSFSGSPFFIGGISTYIFGNMDSIYCMNPSSAWDWLSSHGYGNNLVEWDGVSWSNGDNITESTISGIITTATGEPVPNALIKVGSELSTRSNQSGKWSVDAQKGIEYPVTFERSGYSITGNKDTAVAGDYLVATAILSGELNDLGNFTIWQDENIVTKFDVGTEVQIVVEAPNASFIRLVVDGIDYEVYSVENGIARFSRIFSKAGVRNIQFRIMPENASTFTQLTSAKDITVTKIKDGDLSKPVIHDIQKYVISKGDPLEVTWDSVPNARYYCVYLYYDGEQKYPGNDHALWTTTSDTSISFSGYNALLGQYLFPGEKWTVEVVAAGEPGWSSATGTSNQFAIVQSDAAAWFDKLPAGNRAKVGGTIDGSVKTVSKQSVACVRVNRPGMASDEYETVALTEGSFSIPVSVAGQYTLFAYADGEECTDSAVITVPEPSYTSFDINGYGQYIWESSGYRMNFHVEYNFIPDTVTIYLNDQPLDGPTEKINNSKHLSSFTLSTVLGGENNCSSYKVVAKYGNSITRGTSVIPVYCMGSQEHEGENRKIYKQVTKYITPDIVSNKVLSVDEEVILGKGVYQNLLLVTYGGQEIFIPNDAVDIPEQIVIPLQSITVSGPEHVRVGEHFVVSAELEPQNATLDDDIVWRIFDVSIVSYEGCQQEEGEVSGIQGNHLSLTLTAMDSGRVGIIAATSDESIEAIAYIDVTNDMVDEETYYQMLRDCREENLLKDISIFNAVVSELERNDVDHNTAVGLVNDVKNCSNEVFRNLYLWSLFDYGKSTEPLSPDVAAHFAPKYGTIFVGDNASNHVTWFHESGHAIDWSCDNTYKTLSTAYKTMLYNAVRDPIKDVIEDEVRKAYSESNIPHSGDYPTGDNEIDEGKEMDQYTAIIVDEILGPNNKAMKETLKETWRYGPLYSSNTTRYVISRPDSLPEKYQDWWKHSLGRVAEYIHYNSTFDRSLWWGEGSLMVQDMFSGMTNNTVYTGSGHGAPYYGNNDQFYWYDQNGDPAYSQNKEAWAEYFSSVITGEEKERNENFFNTACQYMRIMANQLLTSYKQKHGGT